VENKPRLDRPLTLADLFKWYFGSQTVGAKEPKTLETERLHSHHALRLLGETKALAAIRGQDLQEGYINKRAREARHKKFIRPETIKKEMDTLRMVWRRAAKLGLVDVRPPVDGLVYPKGGEKPPFQTWDEIERNIARGLTPAQAREQWDALFLSREQVDEVLEFARAKKTRSTFLYPLLVFVAHTGARRSEALRSRVEDVKFDDEAVVIREKKKSQGRETCRRVSMTPLLKEAMRDYLQKHHPGGSVTFCLEPDTPMLPTTVHEAFKWLFRASPDRAPYPFWGG
jgi:integrase